ERAGGRLRGVRVHTVGIDSAVNAGFLGRLAAFGAGRCELVEAEDRLDAAMEHIHRRIGGPLVTDLALHADAPAGRPATGPRLGSLFPGVPPTGYGRYTGPAGGAITLRGRTPDGEPWERRVPAVVAGGAAARALWARARLRDLEDRYDSGERDLEREIGETSLRVGVLCRFTAFVAVDARGCAGWRPGRPVPQRGEQ